LEKTVRGQELAFIGINDVQTILDIQEVTGKILSLKERGRTVIAIMNW